MSPLDVILPWRAANRLYAPPSDPQAEQSIFDRLGFWRSACGWVTVVLVSLGVGKSPYATVVEDGGADLIVNASLGIMVMVVCVAAIYAITGRGRRRTLNAGTVRMLRNIAMLCLTIGVPVLAIDFIRGIYHEYPLSFPLLFLICGPLACTVVVHLQARRSGASMKLSLLSFQLAVLMGLLALSTTGLKEDDVGTALLVLFVGGPLGVWWIVYLFFLLYWIARTVMWIGEVHPMLAPIGAMLIVLAAFVNKLVYYKADEVPYDVWLAMAVVGVVTTCGLGVAELLALRKSGLRLNGGRPLNRHSNVRRVDHPSAG